MKLQVAAVLGDGNGGDAAQKLSVATADCRVHLYHSRVCVDDG